MIFKQGATRHRGLLDFYVFFRFLFFYNLTVENDKCYARNPTLDTTIDLLQTNGFDRATSVSTRTGSTPGTYWKTINSKPSMAAQT